jgi:YidC/Oxa1 family membrane protein insertase
MLPLALLEPIERPLSSLLEWLHGTVGFTWAWSIVALTLMVRMVILPLTVKQIRSMQKLQAHAPELKALQQKYKGDKQRLNEEVMKFYRENKVNPAASCLPIILQIPIFISLFYVLRDAEKTIFKSSPPSELGWLGIVPDITDPIKSHWSGWLLVVIYAASQLSSSYFMSTSMQSNAQRVMLMVLPVVFIPVVIRFPVGLMLYWTTTNLWTVGQGIITRRLAPKPTPPPKKSSRTPPKPQDDGGAGNGAASVKPTPKPTAGAGAPAGPGQQRVRRRKKKGPQAGRRR